MANHTVSKEEVGVYEQTLVASAPDKVTFEYDLREVEILNLDAEAGLYVTVDGGAPTVGGQGCIFVPPKTARYVGSNSSAQTVVQVISGAAAKYCVARPAG